MDHHIVFNTKYSPRKVNRQNINCERIVDQNIMGLSFLSMSNPRALTLPCLERMSRAAVACSEGSVISTLPGR